MALEVSRLAQFPRRALLLPLLMFLAYHFGRSSALLKLKCSVTRSRITLFVSKHTASQSKRNGGTDVKDEPPPDPKKLAMIERLGLDKAAEDNSKTGAQLRKDRKADQRKAKLDEKNQKNLRAKAAGLEIVTKVNSKAPKGNAIDKPIRFTLGNGIEALTASNLLALVESTAPYLFPESGPKTVLEEDEFEVQQSVDGIATTSSAHQGAADRTAVEKSQGPMGWLAILKSSKHIPNTDSPTEDQRIDYFALCMASHFSTVATYVPTDVDSKIRGHCWEDPSEKVILAQYEILKNALKWDVDAVSKKAQWVRDIDSDFPVSGHNGEWLGCLNGAWGAFLRLGYDKLSEEVEEIINQELHREAAAFRYVRGLKSSVPADTALLKLSAILTHNVGDVDQGLSYWELDANGVSPKFERQRQRFSRLAHERYDRFGGEYGRAKALYKELLSAEGHRNYPLREAKCLRMTPDLMLPLGPWYESWGRLVAVHPSLSHEDKVQVARQLIRGCDTNSRNWCVPNQVGYYRALNGMASMMNMEALAKDLDKDCRLVLKEHECRLHLGLSEEAFAARLGSKARDILQMQR